MPQSLANVLVHAVFSTKDRHPVLENALREEAFAYIGGVIKGDGSIPLCIGGHVDHIHMLFRLSRTQTIAESIGKVKAASSSWIKTKDALLSGFSWQAGYAAFCVGRSEVEGVTSYIRNQDVHHAKEDFQGEMRRLFDEHGIEYDERYVWE